MAIDDGGECGGQIRLRIDGIEFARFDKRGDCCPVLSTSVVPGKERILAIEGYRPDGPLDTVVVDLDAPIDQKKLQAIPVFGDVGQSLAERGLCCDTDKVMGEPSLHIGDQWR